MTKPKKTKVQKKLYLTIREVSNGYIINNNTDGDSWEDETKHVFLTSNAVIEFIEKLI